MITPEVTAFAERSVLAWLATVDASGCPNVSPKEVFSVFDSRWFVIANIASPASVRNLAENSQACLSFIDLFVQKGFKVKGRAEVIARDRDDFALWAEPLEKITQGRFPIRSVIVLTPDSIEPIVAPSYRLYPSETTEKSQAMAAMKAYGVVSARWQMPDKPSP
ncbi:pyridoxamine 5'-phosphate oxidase family protein [Hydrogenophaga sp.]|uniref:pyridoxamine 5'-phosphate oxidase family protein n=1 Tax=Hydrogenophaga sp. TaxID=1904254 RepID=UPI002718A8F4|nr:pyridoxamine 5'-phosphate oxidase family protein [Hydrogenophaga sp.]MDO9133710.1 pyridoxamine 5'-phosphate oxidase family protein [Hydrogenophaga sp.]